MTLKGNVATRQAGWGHIFYTDAGSRFITMRRNVAATEIARWGGCTPYGDLLCEGNYWQRLGPENVTVCGSTGPGDAAASSNRPPV